MEEVRRANSDVQHLVKKLHVPFGGLSDYPSRISKALPKWTAVLPEKRLTSPRPVSVVGVNLSEPLRGPQPLRRPTEMDPRAGSDVNKNVRQAGV